MKNNSKIESLNVDEFLIRLENELLDLPKRERETIIIEIQDHLNNLIEEKLSIGIPFNQAVDESINNFISPKDLAIELKKEHKRSPIMNKEEESNDAFHYLVTILSFGIIDISYTLVDRQDDWLLICLGLLSTIVLNIWLYNKQSWSAQNIKMIKFTDIVFTRFILPIIIFWFWFGGDFSIFWLTCLLLYSILMVSQHISFKILLKRKSEI